MWSHLVNEELGLTAAALSFTTTLALIPLLAVTLSALNLFHALETLTPKVEFFLLQNFQGTLGNEGIQLLHKMIQRVQVGKMGSLGALFLVLTATKLMHELDRAVHRIWQIRNQRNILTRLVYYWFALLVFPFGVALWVWIFSTKSIAKSYTIWMPLSSGLLISFLFIAIIFKFIPSTRVHWLPVLVGSFFSTACLALMEKFFKYLTLQVFSYGKIYGSLAAIPTALIWIYLIWLSLLIGIGITAALQKN